MTFDLERARAGAHPWKDHRDYHGWATTILAACDEIERLRDERDEWQNKATMVAIDKTVVEQEIERLRFDLANADQDHEAIEAHSRAEIERLRAALEDVRRAGHVGPQALSREGYIADRALEGS